MASIDATAIERQRVEWSSLRERITAAPATHRLLPDALGVAVAGALGRRAWRRRAPLAAVGGETTLAQARLVEAYVEFELLCRPWLLDELEVAGRDHLKAAISAGRGVLLSCCQVGQAHALAGLAARFCRPYVVVDEPSEPGWAAERVRAHYRRLDGRMIAAEGCFPVVAALLERGSVVTIPFDGSPVSGRPAPLSAVTARLAMATGALVVPAAATRRRHRVGVALAEPLDPLHHGGVDDIHVPLAAAHRRFVLARPEAYRAPRHAPRVAGSHKRLAAARV